MRISKKPEERRNEILNAAEFLFTTKGFAKTTVNEILKEVGIAKGTFYHYFQSKEEVMDAIIERFINWGVEAAKKVATNPNLTAPEKIFQILMAQTPATGRKEEMIEELHQVSNAEMHQKSIVETIRQLTPVIAQVIEQGMEEGYFHTPYPKETVEILLVSSQFLFDEGIFNWDPQELQEKAMAFSYIAETTLGAKKGSFAYIAKMLQQSVQDHEIQGGAKDE
jgi:AcrR family transcriptional regulator